MVRQMAPLCVENKINECVQNEMFNLPKLCKLTCQVAKHSILPSYLLELLSDYQLVVWPDIILLLCSQNQQFFSTSVPLMLNSLEPDFGLLPHLPPFMLYHIVLDILKIFYRVTCVVEWSKLEPLLMLCRRSMLIIARSNPLRNADIREAKGKPFTVTIVHLRRLKLFGRIAGFPENSSAASSFSQSAISLK